MIRPKASPAGRRIVRASASGHSSGKRTLAGRLVNVRLDAERLRRVRVLRARGVVLSDLVRQAIDERFVAGRHKGSQLDVRAVVERIFQQYPDPPDLPSRDYDVHQRGAARRAILRKLRRER